MLTDFLVEFDAAVANESDDPRMTAQKEHAMRRLIFSLSFCLLATALMDSPAEANQPRSFKCKELLPEFTLGPDSDPSNLEVEQLCKCIWSKFPVGGWERETSTKIRLGEDPGWRGRALGPRFGAAVDACGGGNL